MKKLIVCILIMCLSGCVPEGVVEVENTVTVGIDEACIFCNGMLVYPLSVKAEDSLLTVRVAIRNHGEEYVRTPRFTLRNAAGRIQEPPMYASMIDQTRMIQPPGIDPRGSGRFNVVWVIDEEDSEWTMHVHGSSGEAVFSIRR